MIPVLVRPTTAISPIGGGVTLMVHFPFGCIGIGRFR